MAAPIIANQIDAEFGAFLRAQPSRPEVIDCLDPARPWQIPQKADILFTQAHSAWLNAPADQALPNLKWVQTYSSGTEIYPRWLVQGRTVTNGRGLSAPQIAEYVFAAMLLVEKDLMAVRARSPQEWGANSYGTLEGKVLGVLGYGAIGHEVVRRAVAFGMTVRVCRRSDWPDAVPEGVVPCATPQQALEGADHLVLAMPVTPQTTRMVNAGLLSHAKSGLHLINVARGALVDDAALLAALETGRLGKATLDVTQPEPLPEGHPFWSHPQILLTPHESYKGGSERERFQRKVATNLSAYLGGTPMVDVVDPDRGY